MFSLKTWAVWTALAVLMVGAVGQVALAQNGQSQQNSPVFPEDYLYRAATQILSEVKVIAPGSSEFQALVDKFSQEERDTQITRMLPLDRKNVLMNPSTPVSFVFFKPAVKLYLPDTAVLRSSRIQGIIRGNGALIAPLGLIKINDKLFPATLQGEPYTAGGKMYVALYDDSNKVVGMIQFPQEVTVAAALEVLQAHGPEDNFSPWFQIYFTDAVMMNIVAFLQN
ncbi:hypothetical protein HYR54_01795 [Candidatus Acetothermia bacterium]|nr:hypothetical protein [Candidatus Acetothermia bacterium]